MIDSLSSAPQPIPTPAPNSNPINFFGLTNYRNHNRRFGIKLDDRRRHMYVVGKTGMGKTTVLENMVLNDVYGGHGIGLVDPHGDFAEKILDFIPPNRINDVVYFNPCDIDYPIGFNILESINPEYRHLVASGLMGVFKKIWPDVWSARMEYILNNTILALLDFPGTTLLGINRLLADAEYRKRVVANLKDPVVKAFWQTEFASYSDKFRQEAVAPIQNKIGQFLSASIIRNIVAQVKSRINIREIMDTKKIFIINLSKGRIGEDNSRLLGGMLITKIQLSAMERVDTPEPLRNDFFLYVDEFQNFATESFAGILSEARKYRLDLIMAHQYMEQLDEKVLAAVIGNVGTMVVFRVGSTDAEILAKEFAPTFVEEDLVNLPKFHTYLKLMIDGVASRPFSALTMPPIGSATGSLERVIKVSRERYAVSRDKIEDKIARWSGMILSAEDALDALDEETAELSGVVNTAAAEDAASAAQGALPPSATTPAPPAPPSVVATPAPRPAAPATPAPVVEAPTPRLVSLTPPRQAQTSSGNSQPPRPQSSSSGQFSSSGSSRREGSSDSRRNKKTGGLPPSGGEKVLLVDAEQKGISLSSILPKNEPTRHPGIGNNPGQKKDKSNRGDGRGNQGGGRGGQSRSSGSGNSSSQSQPPRQQQKPVADRNVSSQTSGPRPAASTAPTISPTSPRPENASGGLAKPPPLNIFPKTELTAQLVTAPTAPVEPIAPVPTALAPTPTAPPSVPRPAVPPKVITQGAVEKLS